ncbi:MAG: DUF4253 domain-containing protein [Hyphomicrobium sp.]
MQLDLKPAGSPLPFGTSPYPFVCASGHAALARIAKIRSAWQDSTPVIWGDPEEASRLFQLYEEDPEASPQSILAMAQGRGALEMMDEHRVSVRAQYAEWCRKSGRPVPTVEASKDGPPRGSWPGAVPAHQAPMSLFDVVTGKPKDKVLIGLIPTVRSWEAAAFHKFGAWNDCPAPQIHVAIGREWAERFGARLIVNSADSIEYEIELPIETPEEALEVALQQYRYCPDIVDQGTETLERLAASLIGARYWFFWWD